MTTRTILTRVLVLAAVTALSGAAIAEAAPSRAHRERHTVGRIAAISPTALTVGSTTFAASARQLDGFSTGQCVEIESRPGTGAPRVVQIEREDRCAPLATTAPVATTPTTTTPNDDRAGHDTGDDRHHGDDDHGQHGNDD